MNVIVIGDIHGRKMWKEIVEKEVKRIVGEYAFVFIGDYFDPYENVGIEELTDNFNEIVSLKRAFPNTVYCLMGNHEFHYLDGAREKYSRYDFANASAISELINGAVKEGLLQLSVKIDDVLYTHAGVTKTWLERRFKGDLNKFLEKKAPTKASLVKYNFNDNGSSFECYGDDKRQSPMWVRPFSLINDAIDGKQVVGHTQVERIRIKNGIAFTDTLGYSKEYLTVIDGEFKIEKL